MALHRRPPRLPGLPNLRAHFSSARRSTDPFADETLHYPQAPTSSHHSLASFLEYAERKGLDPASTVYVGTHYEYTVMQSLSSYGFFLRRVGGSSDYGIDLLGTWAVPSPPTPIRVLLQCKAISRKASPQYIRELEGAFIGAPPGWRGRNVVGFLVTQHPASKGVRESLGRSRWPMGFISCSPSGQVHQMLWNRVAADQGLSQMGVGVMHGPEGTGQVALTFKGAPISLGREAADGS